MSIDLKVTNGKENDATLFENLDWEYDSDGEITTVEDEFLLSQSLRKILLTRLSEDGAYPYYGSTIPMVPGSRNDPDVIFALLDQGVKEALVRFQTDQLQQIQYQDLSYREILQRIQRCDITQTDIRSWRIDVAVISGANTVAQVSLTVVV